MQTTIYIFGLFKSSVGLYNSKGREKPVPYEQRELAACRVEYYKTKEIWKWESDIHSFTKGLTQHSVMFVPDLLNRKERVYWAIQFLRHTDDWTVVKMLTDLKNLTILFHVHTLFCGRWTMFLICSTLGKYHRALQGFVVLSGWTVFRTLTDLKELTILFHLYALALPKMYNKQT